VVGPDGSSLLSGSKRYAGPSLQYEREIFVRVQAGTAMEEKIGKKQRVHLEYKGINCRGARQKGTTKDAEAI
jgi:hypothetical protein